jgi:hypothetical protein
LNLEKKLGNFENKEIKNEKKSITVTRLERKKVEKEMKLGRRDNTYVRVAMSDCAAFFCRTS